MVTTYLSLGSNLGNREQLLRQAIAAIGEQVGSVVAQSSFIETLPWGFSSENRFLNAAIAVETALSPTALLNATQAIERQLGRTEKTVGGQYHDREVDIDILLYGQRRVHTRRLCIPHPHLAERRFVLAPLAEIAPSLKVPGTGMSVAEMLSALDANS